jgi:putative phosphoesterase
LKIFIFSDIHGRVDNIKNILENNTFDEYVFAGDFFGYFLIEKDALDLFIKYKVKWILGNHDIYFLREISPLRFKEKFKHLEERMLSSESYKAKYGIFTETIERLKSFKLDFWETGLLERRLNYNNLDILISHGSPNNPYDEYIYPDYENFQELFEEYSFDLLILGHTHKGFIRVNENRTIINPGSCSLPRGDNKPSYAVYDTVKKDAILIEIPQKIKFVKETRSKLKLI